MYANPFLTHSSILLSQVGVRSKFLFLKARIAEFHFDQAAILSSWSEEQYGLR